MACDRYTELLSARLDGALTEAEERELEEHLAACPDCRAAGAQLSALQGAFPELEDVEPPEGFAQGVMDRIRAEKKVIPLFKRPQVRALAGLAACLVLAVGLYGAVQRPDKSAGDNLMLKARSFDRDAQVVEGECPQVNASLVDPESADAPQITAYAAPEGPSGETDGVEKSFSGDAFSENYGLGYADRDYAEVILTLDRMPEGGWELIPPETPVSPDGLTVSVELMEQLEQLAREQEITTSRTSWPVTSDHCLIVILDEAE